MPPKEKKLSKKQRQELERLQREEEERIRQEEEEKRRIELEKERQRREKEKQERLAREKRRREAEKLRLQSEQQSWEAIANEIFHEKKRLREIRRAAREWERHMACSHTPDCEQQIEINTFVSKWHETVDEYEITNPAEAIRDCAWAMEVMMELQETIHRLSAEHGEILECLAYSTHPAPRPSSRMEFEEDTEETEASKSVDNVTASDSNVCEEGTSSSESNIDPSSSSTSVDASLGNAVSVAKKDSAEFSKLHVYPVYIFEKHPVSMLEEYEMLLTVLRRDWSLLADKITAFLLMNRAEFTIPGTQQIEFSESNEVQLALWINLEKSSINNFLHLRRLHLDIELPKQLARTTIAVRVLRTSFDWVVPRKLLGSLLAPELYYPLGGILSVEVLSIPPMLTEARHWQMQPINRQSTSVVKHRYPSKNSVRATLQSMRLSMIVPPHILVRQETPIVGWWNDEEEQWCLDDVDDIQFEPASRRLTFSTLHLTHLAILQDYMYDIPFASWSIEPIGYSRAVLVIAGERRWSVGEKEIEIVIDEDGLCSLQRPSDPELHHLLNKPFPPSILIERLSMSGIILSVPNHVAATNTDIRLKDLEAEENAHKLMAILASVFAMTHSEVNTDPKTPSSCCIVNVSSSPVVTFDVLTGNLSQNADISSPDDEEDENDGDTVARETKDSVHSNIPRPVLESVVARGLESDTPMGSFIFYEDKCGILDIANPSTIEFRPEGDNGPETHHNPIFLARELFGGNVADMLVAASPSFTDSVYQLLHIIRPLSLTHV